jgi:hypothetical protein
MLAQRLGSRFPTRPIAASDAGGLRAAGDPQPGHLAGETLEQELDATTSITILGIAPRSFVDTMQRMAKRASESERTLPWRTVTYVTPATTMVFANRGNARLGGVVQRWQSALIGIRNCIRQINSDLDRLTEAAHPVELALLEVDELYLETALLFESRSGHGERMWVSVGPALTRAEAPYLLVDPDSDLFRQLKATIGRMRQASRPIVARQLELSPTEPQAALTAGGSGLEVSPEIRSLQPIGATVPHPSCLPAAIVVIRSAAAGRRIVLLKKRTRFTDNDDFDRLTLVSSRLLEEDLAGALGVPIFTDRDGPAALDAMWQAVGRPEPIRVPLDAYVRAAQREVFTGCGLDITADRLVHRGFQFLDRDMPHQHLLLHVFELVLRRQLPNDELALAEQWNPDQLVRVPEDELYGTEFRARLGRLLLTRQRWLQEAVFSQPINVTRSG